MYVRSIPKDFHGKHLNIFFWPELEYKCSGQFNAMEYNSDLLFATNNTQQSPHLSVSTN